MTTAEQFNPYGLHAIHVPLRMLDYPDLTWGAKCLYGRLALHLGKPREGAHCDPDLDTLAREMGVSIDTIDRWLKELIGGEFIERRRRGRLVAECIFLPHPCFSNSATLRSQETVPIPQRCGVEEDSNSASVPLQFRNPAVSIPQNDPRPIRKKTYRKHSEDIQETALVSSASLSCDEKVCSSSSLDGPELVKSGAETDDSDDESPFSEETPETKDARDRLLEHVRELLRVSTGARKAPDKAITVEILEAFTTFDDFETWLAGTKSRNLTGKARDPHAVYALFRQDAKIRAEGIADGRVKAERRASEEAVEAERQRAAKAAEVKLLDMPMPALRAFGLIQARLNGYGVPGPLKAKLERTGELIAPNALHAAIRGWKRCAQCEDAGTVGTAFHRTLGFCTCQAGIEFGYSKGADWPAEEIARVHASTKDLLVAAARTINIYWADAIENSTVTETASELVCDVPKGYYLYFKEKGFSKVFQLAGEQRAIRVIETATGAAA